MHACTHTYKRTHVLSDRWINVGTIGSHAKAYSRALKAAPLDCEQASKQAGKQAQQTGRAAADKESIHERTLFAVVFFSAAVVFILRPEEEKMH